MRVACQVEVIAGVGSGVHAAWLVVEQDAVIAFVGTCKVQQLLSRALLTVIVDAGDFDAAVDNSVTSNGSGFWGPPVRTEVAPEMVVLQLRGE